MHEIVIVKLDKLTKDAEGSRFFRNFGLGTSYFVSSTPNQEIHLDVVTQEDAKFINLFGTFVDINTGNMALGLYPDSDNYICVGNIYETLSYFMFGTYKMPSCVDGRYFLESMKVNPKMVMETASAEVETMFKENTQESREFDSILLNFASNFNRKISVPAELKYFREHNSKGEFVKELVISSLQRQVAFERVATSYFGAFISEKSQTEVTELLSPTCSLVDILDAVNHPYLEALTALYLGRYNVPPVLLKALRSYGLGVKQRKPFILTIVDWNGRVFTKDLSAIITVAQQMSSMLYLYDGRFENDADRAAKAAGLNILDLLRAVGWEDNMFFSLDLIADMKNRSVYDSIVKRYSLDSLFLDAKITEKDFVMAVDGYRKSVMYLVDAGALYTRKALPGQYAMSNFSLRQLDAAGRCFDHMGKMILKKFE